MPKVETHYNVFYMTASGLCKSVDADTLLNARAELKHVEMSRLMCAVLLVCIFVSRFRGCPY